MRVALSMSSDKAAGKVEHWVGKGQEERRRGGKGEECEREWNGGWKGGGAEVMHGRRGREGGGNKKKKEGRGRIL